MSKLTDNIRRIAKTEELAARIRANQEPLDKSAIPSTRGIGEKAPNISQAGSEEACAMFYGLLDNSYDIGDILAGTAGPTLSDPCSRLNTVTGLTDFDVAENTANEGGVVHLTIQVDGIFD